MTRIAITALIALALAIPFATPLAAKESLGVFSNWGAFRDDTPARCYAIAKPMQSGDSGPFASVANWPGQSVRGQVHIRLSRPAGNDADVTLSIGDRRFDLAANGRNAWAQDTQMDAAIVAALRSAGRMTVSARDRQGRRFSDRYDLSGAATAIDAAIVGCASRG